MARLVPGEGPSRVLSPPVPPLLEWLAAAAEADGPADLHQLAGGLWQAARLTAGQVDREVTVRLLLAAFHLLGRPSGNGDSDSGSADAAHEVARGTRELLRDWRPLEVGELLPVAWALAELEPLMTAGRPLHRAGLVGRGRP